MGPIGFPETVFIVILALLLFGPKKLPELARLVAKAVTEFRRASTELKSTFDREMQNLERETQGIKEVTSTHFHDSYNYDYSSYDSGSPYRPPESQPALEAASVESGVMHTTESASASEGAHLTAAGTTPGLSVTPAPGSIANGSLSGSEHHAFDQNGAAASLADVTAHHDAA